MGDRDEPSARRRWHLRLLGGMILCRADAPEEDAASSPPVTRFRTQKIAALLAFLALQNGRPQPREELAERFWPDNDPEASRTSLRTALAHLRRALEPEKADAGTVLQADKAHVCLNARRLSTDVGAFEKVLHNFNRAAVAPTETAIAALREADSLYRGPLMPGFYEDWILTERDRLAEAHQAVLAALARYHEALGTPETALDYVRRAAVTDPLSEDLRADLIRLLRKANRPAEALRQFHDLSRRLNDELGTAPSPSVRALVADLGAHRSFPSADAAFLPGSTGAASPAAPAAAPPVRLPGTLGRLWGRDSELGSLVQTLSREIANPADRPRLVTLVGPGGVGKTRLSVETARRLADLEMFEGGVFFAPLASASGEAQAWDALGTALQIPRDPKVERRDQVAAVLRGFTADGRRRALLVLDNLEQLGTAGAFVAQAVLEAAPGLSLLATSRQRLALPVEQTVLVPPLGPEPGIALFFDRAQAVEPMLARTAQTEQDVSALVGLLEGFPLAIELAAAWASVLPPGEIRERLAASRLSPPRATDREARHATLGNAIAWSVDLLEPAARALFCRLSAFRGGWDLPAAEGVCDATAPMLAALRERSLVRLDTAAASGPMRFGLHEALREWGDAALTDNERREIARRHAAYFAAFAEQCDRDLREADPAAFARRLDREQDNLHRAVTTALAETDPALPARLGMALWRFWVLRGYIREGRAFLDALLPRVPATDAKIRASLLLGAGMLALEQSDWDAAEAHVNAALCVSPDSATALRLEIVCLQARIAGSGRSDWQAAQTHWEAAQTLAEQSGDMRGLAAAWHGRGVLQILQGNSFEARPLLLRALDAFRTLGDESGTAAVLHHLGNAAQHLTEHEAARAYYEESLEIRRRLGERKNAAMTLVGLGNIVAEMRDFAHAEALYDEVIAIGREAGDARMQGVALSNRARIPLETGDYAKALTLFQESLRLRRHLNDRHALTIVLSNIATTLQDAAPERAAVLYGASEGLRDAIGAARSAYSLDVVQREWANLRHKIGNRAFEDAFTQGRLMCLHDAIELSLQPLPLPSANRK